MVSPQPDRTCSPFIDFPNGSLRIFVALFYIAIDDGYITTIDYFPTFIAIDNISFVVISSPESIKRGLFANGSWSHSSAGAPCGCHIIWYTDDCKICI